MLYVVSSTYNAKLNGIELVLFNSETQKIEKWFDTSFRPYFLSKNKITDIQFLGIVDQQVIEKYNPLTDKKERFWKVILKNPVYVRQSHTYEDVYQNHIKFFQNYIYNKDIKMGMPYGRANGGLKFKIDEQAERRVMEVVNHINPNKADLEIYKTWARLLEYPAPQVKRAALDIEVYNEGNRIPDSRVASLPIITACFAGNDGRRIALLLLQENKKFELSESVETEFFSDEKKLIERIFQIFREYPFVVTFNGDDFDLKYIYSRALRLGIPRNRIPIKIEKQITFISNTIHLDLYKFFSIRAMKVYAFKNKYKDFDLNTIANALLGHGKKIKKKNINDMSYKELTDYCMTDAEITLELTSFNNNMVLNLIFVLMRLSRLPIENVSRQSISKWILSIMNYEHIKRNILIPNQTDIRRGRGEVVSKATIKGKKYKGAIVFQPKAGIYFDVLVLDFASLYPSIIKIYNIGYNTVNCQHRECQKNKIGGLPHWICTKNRSLESMIVGSLRDLRVFWYKRKAKDKKISEEWRNWYSTTEQSIKVILNASYGVFGSDTFPLYYPPAAEQITAIARYIISETAKHAEAMGIKVLYGDTDSIFIVRPPKEKLEELIEWVENQFKVDFEIDKVYRYVCLSGRKKNYFGVFEDGTVDVKGLTGKKKHTPQIIKDAFEEVKKILGEIRTEEEMRIGKKKIAEKVKKVYWTLKRREWKDIRDLAFHITLSENLDKYTKTTPQHVKAARILLKKGYNIGAGSVVHFVKTKDKLGVKPIEEVNNEDIDVAKYVEFLKSTFEQILEPLDIDFDVQILGFQKLEKWLKN